MERIRRFFARKKEVKQEPKRFWSELDMLNIFFKRAAKKSFVEVEDLTWEELECLKSGIKRVCKTLNYPYECFMEQETFNNTAFSCAVAKERLQMPFGGFNARAGKFRFRPFLPDDFNLTNWQINFKNLKPTEWIPEHRKKEAVRVLLGLINRKAPKTKAYQTVQNGKWENVQVLEWIYDKKLKLWLARFPYTKLVDEKDVFRMLLIPYKRGRDEPKPFGFTFAYEEWNLEKVLVEEKNAVA